MALNGQNINQENITLIESIKQKYENCKHQATMALVCGANKKKKKKELERLANEQ